MSLLSLVNLFSLLENKMTLTITNETFLRIAQYQIVIFLLSHLHFFLHSLIALMEQPYIFGGNKLFEFQFEERMYTLNTEHPPVCRVVAHENGETTKIGSLEL